MDEDHSDYLRLPLFEVTRLRKKYSWLNKIAYWENTFKNAKCQLCKNNLLDNHGHPKDERVWWFGKNRKICIKCLDNKKIKGKA